MPRPSRRTILAIATPVAVVVLLVAAWTVATSGSDHRALPNVTVDGQAVGGMGRAQVAAVVVRVAREFASTPVEIDTSAHTYRSTAGQLGLVVDQPRTVAAALALGHDDPLVERPVRWLASLARARTSPVRYRVESRRLALVLISLEGTAGLLPVEPSIVGTPDTVGIRGGTSGRALDDGAVGRALIASAEQGRRPVTVSTEPVATPPKVSDATANALATILTSETAEGLDVTAGPAHTTVPAGTVRAWLGSVAVGRKLRPTIDGARVKRDLSTLLGGLGGKAKDAKITLVGGTPAIEPGTDGEACCGSGAAAAVLRAIEAGSSKVTVPLTVTHPAFTTADAKELGIKEAVGTTTTWNGQPQVKSFTTYYQAGMPRVTNIHRIADLVRGAIVKPGATFSVDDHVGPRTTAKGFVVAGAIADGEESSEVGGGVSQFATTLFNAAFFAGLDFGEYQSHSIHFDRYPLGREATMGYPHPDLQIRNTTPYGLMIWTSYTATSVTVTFYSTQWVSGQQTAQTSAPQGNCTRVTTTRTRTYADGHTATDHVFGVYRPDYGINC